MIYKNQIADDNEKKLLEKMLIGLGLSFKNMFIPPKRNSA